ncbi:MAG: septum formation inhibitor Maf [Gammaproteobacteria bacterium]|nr:septum formation inhibitor Maf [Gammaproteobacteria bacterium]
MPYDRIRLASASPRRSQLLRQIGVAHEVRPVDLDESGRAGESPRDYVLRVAREKASAGAAMGGDLPVLAADTVVSIGEEIFGKPRDENDGVRMLVALSGGSHDVLTAVALAKEGRIEMAISETRVTFRALSEAECRNYWAGGEPVGKAGAYAIQGFGAVFITRIEGSYSGVMGLPLCETAALLDAAGVRRWQTSA